MSGKRMRIKRNVLEVLSGRSVLLPFYHCVAPAQPDHIDPSMYIARTPELFDEDLRYFSSHYRMISAAELQEVVMDGRNFGEPVCHISFDDGLREYHDYALPILEKYGAASSVFINRDFVDNRDMFYRYKVALLLKYAKLNGDERIALLAATHEDFDMIREIAAKSGIDFDNYMAETKPYMTTAQLKSFQGRDVAVGAHGTDHTWFKYLDLEQMRDQVVGSFNFLREELQIAELYFSFPFSDEDVPADFFNWLYDEGECLLSFGISGMKDDLRPEHLHRIPMENDLSPARDIIRREHVKRILRAPFGKNEIRR